MLAQCNEMQRLFEKYSNKFAYVHFLLYPCGEIFAFYITIIIVLRSDRSSRAVGLSRME